MNRLYVPTRGIASWREPLAGPDRPWKRGCSSFEAAVSWETASRSMSGLPGPINALLHEHNYYNPVLTSAIAGHRLDLPGGGPSRCDVWAMVNTSAGSVSLTVEVKAKETFSDDALVKWLISGGKTNIMDNRKNRWDFILSHFPRTSSYLQVRYQLLHRCVTSIIEARRLGVPHTAFIVQSFNAPDPVFEDYADFCKALNISAARGRMSTIDMNDMSLSIGWVDCTPATKAEIDTALAE